MDCRTFRQHHCAFVDDVLPGADAAAMERHRVECESCADFDARVRRSLLVIRNLPPVQCSEDFTERLFQRLRGVEVERRSTLGAFAAAAAVLVLVAGGGLVAMAGRAPAEIVLSPVVASTPAPVIDPLASPVIAASASAGVPMWPALLLADELPLHVAQSGLP